MTEGSEVPEKEQLSADVVNLEGGNIEIVEADHVHIDQRAPLPVVGQDQSLDGLHTPQASHELAVQLDLQGRRVAPPGLHGSHSVGLGCDGDAAAGEKARIRVRTVSKRGTSMAAVW